MSEAYRNRGLVLHRALDLRIDELPFPEPEPGEVIVQIQTVGICGSDVHFYEFGETGPFVVREPMVIGHEPFGVVVGRGSAANRHELGTRVALEPGVPCGNCRECRQGRYNLCAEIEFFAIPPKHGALANYVTINQDFAHPVPDTVSDEAAALLEPLAVAIWAGRKARLSPGAEVLITGAGPVGLLMLQVALASGVTSVAVTDLREAALAEAMRLGATAAIDTRAVALEDSGLEPDVFLECSGNASAMKDGMYRLRRNGQAVLVGIGPEETVMPVARMRRYELTLQATFRYADCFPAAIALAAAGRVDLESLITDRYTLDSSPDAFSVAVDSRQGRLESNTIKAIVDLRETLT
jgi:L-iditol 2-dehydrogenase